MFREALLSVVVGGFFLTIGSPTASAQVDYNNWTRTNHGAQDANKWGIPGADNLGIPCPTGDCQKALNQLRGKHPKARKAQPPTEASDDTSASDDRSGCGSQPCPKAQDPDKIPRSKDPVDEDYKELEDTGDFGH